jgi:hypothetical protein
MKSKALLLVLAAVVFFTASSFASPNVIGESYASKTIRMQILKKLGSTSWDAASGQTADVRVCFRVNEKGKLRLTKVESENPELQNLVQDKLAGLKLNVKPPKTDESYWITIKFKSI